MIKPVVSATIASIKVVRDKPGVYLKQLDEAVHRLTTGFGLKVSSTSKHITYVRSYSNDGYPIYIASFPASPSSAHTIY